MSHLHPEGGDAVYQAKNVRVYDFHDIGNALFGGGPAPIRVWTSTTPGTDSPPTSSGIKHRWNGPPRPTAITTCRLRSIHQRALLQRSGTSGTGRSITASRATNDGNGRHGVGEHSTWKGRAIPLFLFCETSDVTGHWMIP
jgi:hypothetical protein